MFITSKKPSFIKYLICLVFITCLTLFVEAQNHLPRFNEIDIQHYKFEIGLNDSSNIIQGKATIQVKFLKLVNSFYLDFMAIDTSNDFGMTISNVLEESLPVNYGHSNKRLTIQLNKPSEKGETKEFSIYYSGIPKDGLIISKNRFGNRTFFGDNWPNRAYQWLPTVDHPSDKATVEFIVTAPNHYQVVSNGIQIEETNLKNSNKLTRWKEDVPLATKVMVIGVAAFAVEQTGRINGIPVSTWVFPENKEFGFNDFTLAQSPLKYFNKKIGPYSYNKLANVQSKTRYGGMENASCIFYNEKTVTGEKNQDKLFAHEIAHQWFGNSVTEQNWHHVWLSEGFATYLTNLYLKEFKGDKIFIDQMKSDREKVIHYANENLAPIIDSSTTEYIKLLNPNSYQKGSWVLHMLKHKIGDKLFWKGIQQFYLTYKDSTALSSDFQKIMENVSNKKLDTFFNQWLQFPGYPILKVDWKSISKNRIELRINQSQPNYIFNFPLEINLIDQTGKITTKTFIIKNRKNVFTLKIKNNIKNIVIDPNCKLLFSI
jgi:aminopeptidase N